MKTFITKNKFKTRIFYKDYKMNICSIIFLVFLIATELMVLLGIDSGVYDEVIAIFGFFFILLGMIKKDNKAGNPNTVIPTTVITLIGIIISKGDITKLKLYNKKTLIIIRFNNS